MKKRVAIFASGTGSNATNLVHLFKGDPEIEVVAILSNKETAGVLEMAKENDIDTLIFSKSDLADGSVVDQFLAEKETDFIVLAGFLLKFPKRLVDLYPNRVANLHPALLPKFGGKGMYGMNVHRAVVDAGETESGITIHYVNEEYDEGAIIAQFKCVVTPEDDAEQVFAKIRELEKNHFPPTIHELIKTL